VLVQVGVDVLVPDAEALQGHLLHSPLELHHVVGE
jgi:hypothetical protein